MHGIYLNSKLFRLGLPKQTPQQSRRQQMPPGESLNAYIVGAVAQRMDREQPTEDALPPETEEMLK